MINIMLKNRLNSGFLFLNKYVVRILKAIILCTVVLQQAPGVQAQHCSPIYRRFHQNHSGCLPPKRGCVNIKIGMHNPEYDKIEILKIHNEYRSRIAMGMEKRGMTGPMPPAADMIELTWDDEMSYVAQKWSEQCHYDHDCWPCRAQRDFEVGQCGAEIPYLCLHLIGPYQCQIDPSEWKRAIKSFYDEVDVFDRKLIDSMKYSITWGHFAAVNWATAYRVGCGYSIFKENTIRRNDKYYIANHLYWCNYGPSANMVGGRMYIRGPPCSQCPINSCCGGSTCRHGEGYPGLCRLHSYPPLYPPPKQPLRFLCSFRAGDPSCYFTQTQPRRWELLHTIGFQILGTELSQGESASVRFHQWISTRMHNCLIVRYQTNSVLAGQRGQGKLEAIIDTNGKKHTIELPTINTWDYHNAKAFMPSDGYAMLELRFSVPIGSAPQYIDITEVRVTGQGCDERPCICHQPRR